MHGGNHALLDAKAPRKTEDSAMADTTVADSKGSTFYTWSSWDTPSAAPLAVFDASANITQTSDAWTTALPASFVLYVPYSPTRTSVADITAATLLTGLNRAIDPSWTMPSQGTLSYPIWAGLTTPVYIITVSAPELTSGSQLFIPVIAIVPETIDIGALASGMSSYSPGKTSSVISSTKVTSSTSSQASSASGGSSRATTVAPLTSASGVGSSTSAPMASSSPASPTTSSGNQKPHHLTGAAVAGGTIGGFMGGLLLGAMIICLYFSGIRTRRRKSQSQTDSMIALRDQPYSPVTIREEKQSNVVQSTDMTSWQKHLPRERSDDSVARSFRSIFENVRSHIEGYYEAGPVTSSKEDVASLQRLILLNQAQPSILEASDITSLLEGVLIRWLIERISLHSDVEESLLPSEYTIIPKQNQWHMENQGKAPVLQAESSPGFRQAFSQWRLLTSFLYTGTPEKQGVQSSSDGRIDQAIKLFALAYSPWKLRGKNHANRDASLRSIMKQTSTAGRELFAQRSTYAFDWRAPDSDRGSCVVVMPAFVRRLDEHAELSPEVLIEAKVAPLTRAQQ
ncbi:hypothetical protein LTR62_000843 [Meristemomyces frigidus]|uniref:Uncharacterized protein n=1 Tax=Meristemomyces frigidus TaxID=1508187 RepID=A0AAN7TTJ6_9PEZI|nr:hypothetical protein LTR62_000843 [Meristemomyces frigidus]